MLWTYYVIVMKFGYEMLWHSAVWLHDPSEDATGGSLENIAAMMGFPWLATVFRYVRRVKVTSSWTSGPKVSQHNVAPGVTLPLPACLRPVIYTRTLPFTWVILTPPLPYLICNSAWCSVCSETCQLQQALPFSAACGISGVWWLVKHSLQPNCIFAC